jgi:CheY-like chemotaxis protein
VRLTVLVVDRDLLVIEAARFLIEGEGHSVATASTGGEAFSLERPHLALIDMSLPDVSGPSMVRHFNERGVPCVAMAGQGAFRIALEATRLGAVDVIEKPIIPEEFISVTRRISSVAGHNDAADASLALHSAQRWATMVIRAISLPSDPRTLHEWGHGIGVSQGALRSWCRTARQPARRSLAFARILRAIVRQHDSGLPPEDLLNVVDRRTLHKLLAASGASNGRLPPSVLHFLQGQRLIEQSFALDEVRRAMKYAHVAEAASGGVSWPAANRHRGAAVGSLIR